MREVREISHNLMPSILADFGLQIALEKICDRIEKFNELSVNFIVQGKIPKLEKHIEVALYRVAQEAISNASKYSKCAVINVQLSRDIEGLELMVSDNGQGFDLEEVKKTEGIGLTNIEERCMMIKADCNISSKLGKGTEIVVKYKVLDDGKD